MPSIFGIGNPLLDFVTHAPRSLIDRLHTRPGTMNLIGREEMERVLSLVDRYQNIPGGSCANTLRGVAWLSGAAPVEPVMYSGALGGDRTAELYRDHMASTGVQTHLVGKGLPTGCSVIVVTPDCERTMFTYLGACQEFCREDVDFAALARSRFLYFTSYMWDTDNQKEAVKAAVDFARQKGVTVALDLADPLAVQRYRQEFLDWVPANVDILFGNREELNLMAGEKDWRGLSDLVVMKIGAEGCIVFEQGTSKLVPGFPVQAVDTTAAGDSFAAGFLYGMLKGLSNSLSARLANRLASKIVSVEGCDFAPLNPKQVLEVL